MSPGSNAIVRLGSTPRAVINDSLYYGLRSFDLVGPPRRLYSDGEYAPPIFEHGVDALRVESFDSPAALISSLPNGDNWMAQSTRSLARIHALFLVAEDPQSRLVGRAAATLAHQASLVSHVLASPELERVLIADEVGLGKTIEAGLIIRGLLDQQPGLRVLYLAPARLVRNVHREFREKLDLVFRQYSADDTSQADIRSDSLIVASIHRAVHAANRSTVVDSDPWDVIVVDECHHLSAWKANGQDANEQFALVQKLVSAQAPGGRLILMSGTPHQGQRMRFDNLVTLLRRPDEPVSAVRGRVIFRTKEDVRDWNGQPLFPRRDVRSPRVVSMGVEYQGWYNAIAALYDGAGGSEARQRAAGWARGQALQWAASSVQAGLGFLARLSVRRLRWDLSSIALRDTLLALRPYKGGTADEPVEQLYARLAHDVGRQMRDQDIQDMEDLSEDVWVPDELALEQLLRSGVSLLRSPASHAKWTVLRELLDEAPKEKIVLFAQPVETVSALVDYLEREYRVRPSIIVGGQSDDERDAQIAAFRRPDGPRLLVSSKAGGEGVNLQVARRLVHVDVPWNPMDMEQRVGRVHRFGSIQTIIVDTLVVQGTREVDAYRVAREKLQIAFGDLTDGAERFETLFARVMALIPPQEFEEFLGNAPPGPLTPQSVERLGSLVEEGLRRWQEFHDQFAGQDAKIRALDPGAAKWDDLIRFMLDRTNAESVTGCVVPDFVDAGNEVVVQEIPVPAVRIAGNCYACADIRGVSATLNGRPVPTLGINLPEVALRLREAVFPELATGAAWLRRSQQLDGLLGDASTRFLSSPASEIGVLVFLRQTIRLALGSTSEQRVEMRALLVWEDGTTEEITGDARAALLRGLLGATRQRDPAGADSWGQRLQQSERDGLPLFGRPTASEFQAGVRHAVWPIFAAVLS